MCAAQKNCCICHKPFVPNKFSGKRQEVCSREGCRREAKKQRQARWVARNPDYFRGPENVDRVRQWRCKKALEKAQKAHAPPDAQEPADAPSSPKAESCNKPGPQKGALQDSAPPAEPVIMGLLALFSGAVLQDEVHNIYHQCFRRGSELLGHGVPANSSPTTANPT